ncbi:hypothetical protein Mal15_61620 [Stieleria maiorica]|uniref:Integrase SAM-like N-terminal domain-containing protein n=1 Tax=Stieleria maiorica TaxID=2795974 RepID=A0A5B9MLA0_9BACT|nr:hypothetical protein [Stieleria maiorica]QEG02079.1 hypothetical protein Mal15_61620 [Stieleria maiorica]
MTLQRYDACLGFLNLPAKEREWFPRWMKAYADFPSVVADQSAAPNHTVKRELVIAFLQSLRDRKIEAWRRLQAARAIEAYQGTVLQTSEVDFRPIRETLQQLVRRQSSGAVIQDQQDANLVAGEGNAGVIDQSEPECIQRMRATMRRLHHPKSTEDTYVGQIKKFIRHLDDDRLERFGRIRMDCYKNKSQTSARYTSAIWQMVSVRSTCRSRWHENIQTHSVTSAGNTCFPRQNYPKILEVEECDAITCTKKRLRSDSKRQ